MTQTPRQAPPEGDAGDRERDFDAFVRATSPRMLATARLLTGDAHRAEDVVQDAYARVFLRWGRADLDDPAAYVRRCVVNAHTDWWRRRPWRERPSADLPERPGDDAAARCDERAAVTAALRALTPKERAVIVLRYYEQLSEAQIAAALRIAPGTVKSTSARALEKLRRSPHLLDPDLNADACPASPPTTPAISPSTGAPKEARS